MASPDPYFDDGDVRLYLGDALAVLYEFPDESVDCAATSPPFFGLRDYGVEGQIGLESTPEDWAARLVEVFREVRRVLVPAGTLWVECGDSYASGTGRSYHRDYMDGGATTAPELHQPVPRFTPQGIGVKPKDLIGSPFLLAFALRDDGWWWRSTNIWHKPNCLPESVTDRPVVQHSYVMQFSKRARYFHDAEAVREPYQPSSIERAKYGTNDMRSGVVEHNGLVKAPVGNEYIRREHPTPNPAGRALRSVWTIPTSGYADAHFATWAPKLAERILLMACPAQVCRVCGKARERVVVPTDDYTQRLTRPNLHNHDQKAFRAYISEARELKGLKRSEVSQEVVGTPSGACWNWEHHQPPRWDMYLRLKAVLELDDRFDEFLLRINGGWEQRATDVLVEGNRKGGRSATAQRNTLGFTDCGHSDYRPGIVLDPFAGASTTLVVARRLGRHGIGIDLSEEYLAMSMRRLKTWWRDPPQPRQADPAQLALDAS